MSIDQRLIQLHQQINTHFNEEELRTFVFNLNIDYDNLEGNTKSAKARELVLYAKRHNRLPDVMAAVKSTHPTVPEIVNLLPEHDILHRQNLLFIGRETLLEELHTQLSKGTSVAVTQALAGLGGIGKTQLALAYSYKHLDDYDLITWLKADSEAVLDGEMAALAYRLGLAPRTTTDQNALRQAALNWLQTTASRWLLVFDNADHIEPNVLANYLPKLGNGANLITTRNPNWGSIAQKMGVDVFSEDEAIDFLLRSSPLRHLALREEAKRLAAVLGYLPLALEHARAYVEATGCSLGAYANYFEKERQELWAEIPEPQSYDKRTITTTWELALKQIEETMGANELLHLFCFVAPDNIPFRLLLETTAKLDETELPEGIDALAQSHLKQNKAIAALMRFSLLNRSGETVTIHRLVQTVLIDRLPKAERTAWLTLTTCLMNRAWPFDDYNMDSWPPSAELLPHLLMAIQQAETFDLGNSTTANLNGQAGYYLRYTGNIRQAGPLFHKALQLDENIPDTNEETLGLRLNNLGQLLKDLGRYEEAWPYMERALAIDEKALGSEHPDVAVDLNNLGQLLQAEGRYKEARPYMERALAIDEKALGPEHPDVAIDLNNLGGLLKSEGRYDEARPYMERALAIDEKVLGSEHPGVGRDLNNLGSLLLAEGRYEEARPYMERALAIDEKVLGPEHPDVGRDLNNLGQLLQVEGRYEEARPYMEQALAVWEKVLGAEHPQVGVGNNNLGQLLKAMGKYEEARPYIERALAIDENALGPEHPSVGRDLNNLGQLLQDLGRYEEARPYMERALAIDEKALGPEHPDVGIRLNNLGQLLRAEGRYEEARPYMERALAIDENALGPEHPSVGRDLNNLGQLLQDLGRYEEAQPYMERALAIDEKALGPEHPTAGIRLNNLGQLLQDLGRYEEAQPYLQRALTICEAKLGVDHPNTQIVRKNLELLLNEMNS